MLAPLAINAVSSIFSSGKDKEKANEDSKYKALADAAMSAISRGQQPSFQPTTFKPLPPPENMNLSSAADYFKQSMESNANPIMAGMNVARSLYANRDTLKNELVDKAKGVGGWVKGLWNKVWNNRGEIANGIGGMVGDYLTKKARLA